MVTIVTRSGKGSPLTNNEMDDNLNNLNSGKTENSSAAITGGTIDGATIGATTPSTIAGTTGTFSANVGINEVNPQVKLHVQRTTPDFSPTFDASTTAAFVSGGVTGSGSSIAITSGNAGVASVYFGDTDDTSIGRIAYDNTIDSMRLFTNNTEKMRISANGNVGIGTTSPATQLHVSGTTAKTAQFTASIANTTMTVGAFAIGDTGIIGVGDIVYGVGVAPITRILSQLTGTTGSSGTYEVSVSQTVASNNLIFTASSSASRIRISDTNTSSQIGAPAGSIEFFGSDTNSPGAGVGAYISAISADTSPDTNLVFGTRSTSTGAVDANERLRIDSNGNVGIGINNPQGRVHVYSTDTTTYGDGTANLSDNSFIVIQNDSQVNDTYSGIQLVSESAAGTTGWWSIASVSTATNYDNHLVFHQRTGAATYAERMRIESGGNVGVGTTNPSQKLEVASGSVYVNGSDGEGLIFNGSMGVFRASSTSLAFNTGGTERLRIAASGQIGIGGANYGTSGQTIVSAGSGAAPAWGTLPVTGGGTGVTTSTGTGSVVLGTAPTITNAVLSQSNAVRAAGTLALAFGTNQFVQVTPNATGTFTTTVPVVGTTCTLIVLTSGTTSYTMTFGTGFKSTGTLATGTVSARYFIFQFVSNGTSLIEAGRTVAIA